MKLLQEFINSLLNQKNKPSLLTVKNYKADIKQFIGWFEKESSSLFNASKVTLQTLQEYKKITNLSESSIKRHMSSLHRFFNFLKNEGVIVHDPLEKRIVSAEERAREDPWMFRNFKNFLHECKKTNLTIKNYLNDLKGFSFWFEEVALMRYAWNVTDKSLASKISPPVVQEYKQRLIAAKFSPLTINRKLSSLRNYMAWAKNQGLIQSPVINSQLSDRDQSVFGRSERTNQKPTNWSLKTENREPRTESISKYSAFPPKRLMQKSLKGAVALFDNLLIVPLAQVLQDAQYLFWKVTGKKIFRKTVIFKSFGEAQTGGILNIKKEFYAPLNISTHYLSFPKRIWHYTRHSRPNWYKRYHSYPFTHYLHFAVLMTLSCAIGFGIYSNFFENAQKNNAVLGTSAEATPQILSFQGKLTDSFEAPITKESTVLFSLYNSENAPVGDSLWQEDDAVKPDSNGAFSLFLGKKIPIPDTIFTQNSKIFLGIRIGNSPELWPRQELATVHLANSAKMLQGLEPIINTTKVSNVILALNSSGNLSIAGDKTHIFQVIGGNFVLSGKVLSLTTVPGSNSNVEIMPDGMGKIDFSKPIQNSTNNNNLTSAMGSVEFDDTVAILATTSAQAALYINQNSTGALISASTSETAKFTVGNDGTGMFAGGLEINGGDLTSTAATFNLLDSSVTALNLGGTATTINIGNSEGVTAIKSKLTVNKDITLLSFSSNGGILYTNESGKILQTSGGSSSDCLMGGNTPYFAPCSNIFNQASSIGIGTTTPLFKLDIQASQGSTAAAQIYNTSTGTDADGLVIKLGNSSASSVSASNHFINFETAGIGIVGSVQGNGGSGVTYATSGIADFAEYLKKDQNQAIDYGSVVCLRDNGLAIKCDSNHKKIVGVASERPAFLGGKNLGDGSIAVGLIGQVEILVTTLNAEIKTGDMLTASDIPGVAIKAGRAGQIIGKALEDLSNTDEAKIAGFYDPDNQEYRSKADFPNIPLKSNIVRVFKIPALINVSWYDPEAYLAQNGNLIINSTGLNGYSVSNSKNENLSNIGGFFEVITANIKAGLIKTGEIVTQSLIVTSDSIVVNGQNLKDYIVSVVGGQAGIISPVSSVNRLSANTISPLGESLIVRLATPSAEINNSSFIIQNSSGSAVAKIDDRGNASFSGALESLSLQTNDASISGTLRAGNILADSIEGLETRVSSYINLASYSAQLFYVPDLAADRAQFNQGLMVFGSTSLGDLSIAGRLSIGGAMFATENSLEVLGTDLYLQSLKQGGLSIMGGLVYVDTNGNIKIQGDLSVSGNLAVNIISPLPISDLIVTNASGSGVLSINQAGDIISSGSGTFTKLNFSFTQPVLAVSATEATASSSAGVASIASYQSELTIKNPLVTDKSVIYITPVGTPSAQAPFLMRQAADGFTVGVQSPTNRPIDFNWLIVN